MTDGILEKEPVKLAGWYRPKLKRQPQNSQRDSSAVFRGFGRTREADGRKTLAFSTLGTTTFGVIHGVMGRIANAQPEVRRVQTYDSSSED